MVGEYEGKYDDKFALHGYLFRRRDSGYKNGTEGMVCYLIITPSKKWNYIARVT